MRPERNEVYLLLLSLFDRAQLSKAHPRISNFDAEAALDGRRRNDDYALGIPLLRLWLGQIFFYRYEHVFY